jgi:hypothetical protein
MHSPKAPCRRNNTFNEQKKHKTQTANFVAAVNVVCAVINVVVVVVVRLIIGVDNRRRTIDQRAVRFVVVHQPKLSMYESKREARYDFNFNRKTYKNQKNPR